MLWHFLKLHRLKDNLPPLKKGGPRGDFSHLPLALCLAFYLTGCGEAPIAQLTIEPASFTLPHGQHRVLRFELHSSRYPLIGGCPTVFVHLVDEAGQVQRAFDHRPPSWTLGEVLAYDVTLFRSLAAPPEPAGPHALVVGLYDPGSGRRFALDIDSPEAKRNSYRIGTVDFPEPEPPPIKLQRSGHWLPPETVTEGPSTSRHWFHRQATLTVTGRDTPIRLRLVLRVPDIRTPAQKAELRLQGDATEPRVTVEASCAPELWNLSGGVHELWLDLDPGGKDGECQIKLKANFDVPGSRPNERVSAAVDALTWVPAERSRSRSQ